MIGDKKVDDSNNPKPSYSLKRLTLISVDLLSKSFKELGPDNDFALCLVTPSGLLVGSIRPENHSSEKKDYLHCNEDAKTCSVDIDLAFHQLDEALGDKDLEFRQDSACFTMENVSFLPGSDASRKICFDSMIVFVDQVISASIVPRNFASFE